MRLVQRLRRDLEQPDRPIGREELPFVAGSALVVVLVAQLSDPGTAFDLALLVLAAAAFTARTMWPRVPAELSALAVVAPVTIAVGHQGRLEVALFLVVITTLYSAWHLGSTTRSVLIAIVSCVAIVAVAAGQADNVSWAPWLGAELFTFILGRILFRQRSLINELDAARTQLADQAVAEERRRIARELHDLAGHTLAAMLLHVTGARHVLRRDTAEAERALRDAEAVGRQSLQQIRATVTALRTTERGTDPALPERADLDGPIADYDRAGLSIDADIAEEVEVLQGPVAVALHRISREALANVARHAPANRVNLRARVDRELDQVRLDISDHGQPPAPSDGHDGGFGLVGMRERARSLGGTLIAEPTADGWRVEATLPLPLPLPLPLRSGSGAVPT